MDGLAFLDGVAKAKVQPIYVLCGTEDFLKRHVRTALRTLVLGEGEGFGLSSLSGDKAAFAAVRDELEMLPFFGSRRLVVVEQADAFVSRERERLEKYFAEPSKTGVLVLDVKAWPETTRLAKVLPKAAVIDCEAPKAAKLAQWCVEWCQARHGKPLTLAGARLLVDLVGSDMGLLDQEMAKLAAYIGDRVRIDSPDIDQLVANNRTEKIWKVFDFINAGKTGEAVGFLGHLLDQGEEPLRLLAAFSTQVRQLARAGRLGCQGTPMPAALEHAGVPPFARRSAEQQLRQLGRRRLDQLYDWLLQVDLGIKGASQLPPRVLLERLVVQLARPRA
jgi:DNA polymerase-3 subunit delta